MVAGPEHAGQVGVLVMSHGTPPSLDLLPSFYTEIRRGNPPPPELLADLERRYRAIGGVSPLNERTREQEQALAHALESLAPGCYLVAGGAKFADPRIEDALETLVSRGAARVVGLVLAPHAAEVSVGDYERRARAAAQRVGERLGRELPIDVVRHWYDAPGFDELLAARVRDALDTLPVAARADAEVLFTAHSVPMRFIDAGDPYALQVGATARAVAERAALSHWRACWQSAGRTDDAWLGPDLLEVIRAIGTASSAGAVVVCPAGFVSDHLEVLYDVDIEARAVAEECGLAFARTRSFNADPEFCALLARVVHAASAAPAGRAD